VNQLFQEHRVLVQQHGGAGHRQVRRGLPGRGIGTADADSGRLLRADQPVDHQAVSLVSKVVINVAAAGAGGDEQAGRQQVYLNDMNKELHFSTALEF
jgi:hypothetical protein